MSWRRSRTSTSVGAGTEFGVAEFEAYGLCIGSNVARLQGRLDVALDLARRACRLRLDARVDVGAAPWRSIEKVQAAAGGVRETCTAALIGPRTVVTAAHCLFNVRSRYYFLPSSVHFLLGLDGSHFTSATIAASFLMAPGYDPEAPDDTLGNDWALVSLAAPLPDQQTLGLAMLCPRPEPP